MRAWSQQSRLLSQVQCKFVQFVLAANFGASWGEDGWKDEGGACIDQLSGSIDIVVLCVLELLVSNGVHWNVAFTGGWVLTLTVVFRRCWIRVLLIRLATVSIPSANQILTRPVCLRCNFKLEGGGVEG